MSWAGTPSVIAITVWMPGVDGLVDRVGGERAPGRRPSTCWRRARSTASATVSSTGTPSTSCPPLPGVTPATSVRPVGAVPQAVEAALRAGEALDDETRLGVDEDRHSGAPREDRELVERQAAVGDALAEERSRAPRPRRPRSRCGRATRRSRTRARRSGRRRSASPPRRRIPATRPRCSSGRATGRGASPPPRRRRP